MYLLFEDIFFTFLLAYFFSVSVGGILGLFDYTGIIRRIKVMGGWAHD